MSKIFKNMIPYWKSIIIILALLMVQAWCDLSLPAYTSDIIDVGIIDSGVEHVVPQAVTDEEFELAKLFMTEDESKQWDSSYERDGEVYRLTVEDEDELTKLDDALTLPLILRYQMSAMEENPARLAAAGQMTEEQLLEAGIPAGLIRISCGLEDKEDLIADLAQALEAI